ncbi:MAG: hypothetical protein E7406_01815 [Ruminococcaceae bacterium]|nr:hypothetical protein [Oscillospiraceae bacterium]
MDLFCGNCGSKMGADGKCPNCGALSTKKPVEKAKERKPLISKKTFIKIVVGLSAYTVIVLTLLSLVFFDVINIPFINDIFIYTGMKEEKTTVKPFVETEPESEGTDIPTATPDDEYVSPGYYDVPSIDAEEYHKNTSDNLTVLNAFDSQSIHSESEAYENLTQRGFDQSPITTDYDMDGTYTGEATISSYSSRQHPIYQTYYTAANGDIWCVFEVNGSVFAYPLFYDSDAQPEALTVLSETDTFTSYDGNTNNFFIKTPYESEMLIKQVSRIDAGTLDSIEIGGIN